MRELFNLAKSEWKALSRFERVLLPLLAAFLMIILTAPTIYSSAISGTNVAAPVVPFDTQDTYPSHMARYGKGGMVQWQTTSQRNAIPIQRRYTGMYVFVWQTRLGYQLYSGTSNAHWRKQNPWPVLGKDYFDGRPGAPPLFLHLSSGFYNVNYDQAGLNPSYVNKAFRYVLYLGGQVVSALRQYWFTGAAPRQVSGTGTGASFTPAVQSTYSANRTNNIVCVQATYSANAINGGKRVVTTCAPISVTKVGATGIQGPPGQDATVTEAAVISAFSTTASNNPLVLRTSTGTQSKFEVWDTSNNTRMWFDTQGNQYWKMANGDTVVKILTDGSFFVYRGGVKRAEILNNGTIATYHTNGTTATFRNLSTGAYYGKEGLPASNGLCMSRDMTTGIISYITCGTGGGGTPGGSDKQFQYNNNGSFGGSAFLRYTSNGVIITGALTVK